MEQDKMMMQQLHRQITDVDMLLMLLQGSGISQS